MSEQGTQLLAREVERETAEKIGRRRGWARLAPLLALLVVGAAVSFGAFWWRAEAQKTSIAEALRSDRVNVPLSARQKAEIDAGKMDHTGHMSMSGVKGKVRKLAPTASGKETGFRVTRIAVVAGGGMTDLRYEVTDPKKAMRTLGSKMPAYLLDEATNKSVAMTQLPGMGNMGGMKAGTTYYVEFGNPGSMFEPGDSVTLAVGPYRIQHLEVQ